MNFNVHTSNQAHQVIFSRKIKVTIVPPPPLKLWGGGARFLNLDKEEGHEKIAPK